MQMHVLAHTFNARAHWQVFRAPQNRHMQHGLNAAQVDAQLKAKGIHLTLQQVGV
jgi:hypothetical protein